jgi:hypothetical protein
MEWNGRAGLRSGQTPLNHPKSVIRSRRDFFDLPNAVGNLRFHCKRNPQCPVIRVKLACLGWYRRFCPFGTRVSEHLDHDGRGRRAQAHRWNLSWKNGDRPRAVRVEELTCSNMIQLQALIELLTEKGLLAQQEILDRIKGSKQRAEGQDIRATPHCDLARRCGSPQPKAHPSVNAARGSRPSPERAPFFDEEDSCAHGVRPFSRVIRTISSSKASSCCPQFTCCAVGRVSLFRIC